MKVEFLELGKFLDILNILGYLVGTTYNSKLASKDCMAGAVYCTMDGGKGLITGEFSLVRKLIVQSNVIACVILIFNFD